MSTPRRDAGASYVTAEDGVRIAYRKLGRGAGIVVVPAMSWIADDLTPLAGDRTLLFHDIRSQGLSDPAADHQISFQRDVADLECLRSALGIERMTLLGWSYHGAVTAHYALLHPDRVERMVLVAPLAPRATPYWRQYLDNFAKRLDIAALRELELRRRDGTKDLDPVAWCRAHTELILRVYVADPTCLRTMKSSPCVRPNLDPEVVNKQILKIIDGLGDYDWRREMAGLRTPLLIVHGDRDPVPLQGSFEWIETLPDARLRVLEGSGHLPWLEQPDHFFPPVNAFLSGEDHPR
jgi:proline iminopeptidase